MAELLKNIYNKSFFDTFIGSIEEINPDFKTKSFRKVIHDNEWEDRELKQRMRHISVVLHSHLSGEYPKDLQFLLNLIPTLEKNGVNPDNLEYIFLPDFIELYGLEHYEISIQAIEKVTQFVSCEFGIRPFILKYPKRLMKQMYIWSNHHHASVRRLSSEGCRPRLPWAMALPFLKKEASPILPILENLKADSSEYVRRSVANNLNDISKDNPEFVIKIAKKWNGKSENTDRLVKHASRTLLKQGNPELMHLFGFRGIEDLEIKNFTVLTPEINIGNSFEFSFSLINKSSTDMKVRLEYGLYYQKANGSLSKKVFKISEKEYAANSETSIIRKQHFKPISTRKYHLGLHQIALVLNGVELDQYDFNLTDK